MTRMGLDRAGWPFIGGAAALAVGLGAALTWLAAVPFLVLGGFFVFFFRDPERSSPSGGNLVLSPADGRVLVAGAANPEAAPPGRWQQVSIFLSPMDVHVNRMPVSGRVTSVTLTPGRFLPAYRHEAATTNERSEVFIDHGGQTVVARQIVGFLARRVVCRTRVGAEVVAGERFGVMKFGSRMDVFLPLTASLRVSVGQTVRAAETVIAVLD